MKNKDDIECLREINKKESQCFPFKILTLIFQRL